MSADEKVMIDNDGLPAMVVGRWVTDEKHKIIRRYVHASYGARNKWSARAYIDLFPVLVAST